MKYLIENCAGSALSALRAQEGGAQRVELCAALSEGGLSPSYGEVKLARRLIDIKLHVLVRPRSGDFLYSPLEEELMLEDIRQYLALGVDGFVLGALTPEGDIDRPLMECLIRATEGRPVTFHRALDMCRAPLEALEDIIALGCQRVLSSGAAAASARGVLRWAHPHHARRRHHAREHPAGGPRDRRPRAAPLCAQPRSQCHALPQSSGQHGWRRQRGRIRPAPHRPEQDTRCPPGTRAATLRSSLIPTL